jgi:methylenetetrahydrofolate reductase (NADPH)
VNGLPSTHPEVGWGGPGGYCYQKAYVEFFCSPASLKKLLEELPRHTNLSYHAMNAKGEEYTNNSAAGQGRVNAVTWGVFPGREIVQPTVVDSASFAAWKVRVRVRVARCGAGWCGAGRGVGWLLLGR